MENELKGLVELLDELSTSFNADAPEDSSATCLEKVVDSTKRITSLVDQVQENHVLLQRVVNAKAAIHTVNLSIMDTVQKLKQAEKKLDSVLAEAEERRRLMKQANTKTIPNAEIISYAHRLGKYTSPPPPGFPIIYPPIPQDAHMKRSLLFQTEVVAATQDYQESSEPQVLLAMDVSKLASSAFHVAHGDDEELLDLEL
ncbi:hypothetical protein HK101_007957 [Irineochytrium annulatum]|nr:hypothetical protein HK101_007957 [Irineochytrium annulatum]